MWCPHPRVLHSFPTRRSSDLAQPDDQRDDVAARWALWRAEKARRAEDHRGRGVSAAAVFARSEEHTPELQSPGHLVSRLPPEKKTHPPVPRQALERAPRRPAG